MSFRPHFIPTAIGSLPHHLADDACDLVLRYLPEAPMWPQLPKRSAGESMYVQFFDRLPGATIEGDKVVVERGKRLDAELEQLYADYLDGATAPYALNGQLAQGFRTMCARCRASARPPGLIKGQVTGPISAGLQIVERDGRPVLYDDLLSDALGKYLRLLAAEQERELADVGGQTMMFLDEPYLNAVGSAFIQIGREQVIGLLGEVLGGLKGLKAVHCCGNTDWALVLSTPIDILSFDAYNHAETLALYPRQVQAFLDRGGVLAWGIVPTDEGIMASESAASLKARLVQGMRRLIDKGIPAETLTQAAMVTPACGLAPMSLQGAERALDLTAQVARQMRDSVLVGS